MQSLPKQSKVESKIQDYFIEFDKSQMQNNQLQETVNMVEKTISNEKVSTKDHFPKSEMLKEQKENTNIEDSIFASTARMDSSKHIMSTSNNLAINPFPNEQQTHRHPSSPFDSDADVAPSSRVIAFYYGWYGNKKFNGRWLHWDHRILVTNGRRCQAALDEIGANFWPALEPYSSIDPLVLETHMRQMKSSRIGVLCISWWGKNHSDSQLLDLTGYSEQTTSLIMNAAAKYNLKVAFHHEPYEGRTPSSFIEDIKYVIDTYGNHPAFFRWKAKGNRPLFLVYDSYLSSNQQWAIALGPSSPESIRGTPYDSIVIALLVISSHLNVPELAHFDGVYTYFATDGFTFGSGTKNWVYIAEKMRNSRKIFIPSVGPGYDDTRIRPWNEKNKRNRENGSYYDKMWSRALEQCLLDPSNTMLSITSFNEWHEGTQIEPSIPKNTVSIDKDTEVLYDNYLPQHPDFYLQSTRKWIDLLDPLG